MMKKINKICVLLALIPAFLPIVHAHQLDQNLQQKLIADGKKYDFNFEAFDATVIKTILERESNLKVEISNVINHAYNPSFKAKQLTYLDYLQQGADRLKLEAIQVDTDKIILVPKN